MNITGARRRARVGFAEMADDLRRALAAAMAQVRLLLARSPATAYARIVEIGEGVGRRHGVRLVVNFPGRQKILDYSMYGRRDLSVIVDRERTRFPVPRDEVKAEASRLIPGARTEDAYMYEGKEGVKVFHGGGRIDVLPHSLHIWCELTPEVSAYCGWLMERVYARP